MFSDFEGLEKWRFGKNDFFRFQFGEFKFPFLIFMGRILFWTKRNGGLPLSLAFLDGLGDISQPQLVLDDPSLVKLRDCGPACF